MESKNPFEFVGANDLSPSLVLEYYIEDFNYSRFIQSKRNVILVGERGCGKSMTLRFNSWEIQRLRAERASEKVPTDLIGVYVPCNTPLTHKLEYKLLGEVAAAALSEHNLALALLFACASTLASVPDLLSQVEEAEIRERLEFVLDEPLPPLKRGICESIMDFVRRTNRMTQKSVNAPNLADIPYDGTFSFTSLVLPALTSFQCAARLRSSHFMFLVDDAHDLNEYQVRSLNSFIAYRDHSLFSFKVATASVARTTQRTASGGSILEGHDFTRLDMVAPLHNEVSDFGRLAKRLVEKRLEGIGFTGEPEEYFPIGEKLARDLAASAELVKADAERRFAGDVGKIGDYVYKYARAHYFRSRSPKANRPEYSGFDTLVFLSTGVIRNLLSPCYWMYDKLLSLGNRGSVMSIPASVQNQIILERSRFLWDWLRDEIDHSVENCSRLDAVHCYQLLDNLAILFRERLLRHQSEPRANSFTVSGAAADLMGDLEHLFGILEEGQLLYIRSGSAKDRGRRERYFVPNRMLWPERGLDPHGQHARVSLSAKALWLAAFENRPIPFGDPKVDESQGGLFS